MRKKVILIIFITTVLGVLSYLGFNVISIAKEKNKIAKQSETIPEFEFLTLEQQPFSKANLKPNLNTIFIYFNSECDFCQHEAQSISESIDKFKNIQLVFVTTEPTEKIETFSKQYDLNNKENIVFLQDNKEEFSKIFKAVSIPFTLIYDKKQQLIKTQKGQLNAVGVLRIINEQK